MSERNINLDGLESTQIGKDLITGAYIYSLSKMVRHFKKDGMSEEEALEFIDYNVVGLSPNGNFIILVD
tara:strand:- start:21882 stop:22088 length:207 start_codon:yes stop_codon:yes gene_type:complete